MKVPIVKIYFDEAEEELLLDTLRSGWIVQGTRVKAFEDAFSHWTGAEFAAAVSSCTTGLHLSLAALGIGPGDEVIVPSFTYIATANAVEHTGATPVFCDVDIETYNIDPRSFEEKITERTRAVIPVHLFGLAAEMDPIVDVCAARGISIVEDAACGLGSRYHGRHVGTIGDLGCFSFHPRKIITTAEGGMIIGKDRSYEETIRSLRDHGARKSDFDRHADSKPMMLPDFEFAGFNYRMTDLQGALGVAQMKKLDEILKGRRDRAAVYDDRLKGIPSVKIPVVPHGCEHGYQSYVIRIVEGDKARVDEESIKRAEKRRNSIIEKLESLGISTRQGTHAVHTLSYYRKKYGMEPMELFGSLVCDHTSIALPLYPNMSEDEQEYVIDSLLSMV